MLKQKTHFETVPLQIAKKAAELELKPQKSSKPSRTPKNRGFFPAAVYLTQ